MRHFDWDYVLLAIYVLLCIAWVICFGELANSIHIVK